jgi:hypothetical protein
MSEQSHLYREPEEYLHIFEGTSGVCIQDLVEFYHHIDFTGSPVLTRGEFEAAAQKFGQGKKAEILRRSFVGDDVIFLRGEGYYPGYLHLLNADALDFIRKSFSGLEESLEYAAVNADRCSCMSDRLFLSQSLDHRKNLALLLFTGLFESMIRDERISLQTFDQCYGLCSDAVKDYYDFIIFGKKPNMVVSHVEDISSSIHAEHAYSSKRSLSREMDHPGRILLYSANFCSIADAPYDFSVNPLRGAAEIGFAIKAISGMIDKEVIGHLNFVRYSTHDERHDAVANVCDLMEKYIPRQLWHLFEAVKDGRVIIIDDNITGGNTLKNLKRALDAYCRSVDVSVVEINREHLYELLEDKGEKQRVFPTRKMLPASIGEWRDQREIVKSLEKRMRQAMLHGKV